MDLRPYLHPARCAVLVIECQEGILGQHSSVPDLARSVRERGMLATLAELLACGSRAVAMAAGSRGAAILPQLGPDPHDVLVPRDHGLTAFHETGLDGLLRSAGVSTVIPTGVSINIAITGATIEAANRGYHVVIPTDCVAGAPVSFAEDALRYCLRNLAYLTTAGAVCETWRALQDSRER